MRKKCEFDHSSSGLHCIKPVCGALVIDPQTGEYRRLFPDCHYGQDKNFVSEKPCTCGDLQLHTGGTGTHRGKGTALPGERTE